LDCKCDTSTEKRGDTFFRKRIRNFEEKVMRVLDGGCKASPVFRAISKVLIIVVFANLFFIGITVFT